VSSGPLHERAYMSSDAAAVGTLAIDILASAVFVRLKSYMIVVDALVVSDLGYAMSRVGLGCLVLLAEASTNSGQPVTRMDHCQAHGLPPLLAVVVRPFSVGVFIFLQGFSREHRPERQDLVDDNLRPPLYQHAARPRLESVLRHVPSLDWAPC
jgi:hypothetical protein